MGKIAKPQRSKKHKKLKAIDPFYVGDRPSDKNAYKFDQKPRHLEEQEFSRSAQAIMKAKNDIKMKSAKKSKIERQQNSSENADLNENLGVMERGVTRPFKPVPDFKKRTGESEKSFLHRVDRETAAVLQKAKFDDKYDVEVDVLDNDEKSVAQSGNVEVNHKTKRLKTRKAKVADKKRQQKEDRFGGFAALKDNVKFGEVAHQPPTFTAKPRKAPDVSACKPGTKSLLLKKMLSSNKDDTPICDEDSTRKRSGSSQRLSLSQRAMLEAERERVVLLYREMKNQQRRNT